MHEDPVTKSKRVTDSSGAIVSTIELDPFGADTNKSSNAAFQPHKYTSYERDGNASDEAMFRRFNRYHSRFDQPDPYEGSYDATDPQSFNRYAYTQNDPANFFDPSGLSSCGVKPNTGTPGFTNDPRGVPGHLRPGVGGQGYFGASRKHGTGSHQGLDISGVSGASAIYASLSGIVTFAGNTSGDAGKLVIINHGDGLSTRYAHLSSFTLGVKPNTFVFEGDQIGVVGQTGNAAGQPLTEAHVHFGVQLNGRNINPANYLNSPCPGPQGILDSPLPVRPGPSGGGIVSSPMPFGGFGGFGGWTSLDLLYLMFNLGGHVTVTVKPL